MVTNSMSLQAIAGREALVLMDAQVDALDRLLSLLRPEVSASANPERSSLELDNASSCSQLMAVAADLPNLTTLLADLPADLAVVKIHPHQDAIAVISSALAATRAQSLSIVAHGSPGRVLLGQSGIDRSSLINQAAAIRAWGVQTISLFSCQTGADAGFIQDLSVLSGAEIYASAKAVGHRALGGSWTLTNPDGLAGAVPFSPQAQSRWQGTLAVLAVTAATKEDLPPLTGEFTSYAVTIPDSVTSILSFAFLFTPLTSVTIPDSVTSIGTAAFRGTQLTSVTIPDSVTSIGTSAFFGTRLTSVTIPDSVTSIGNFAFAETPLTLVRLPQSVITIGSDAFPSGAILSRDDATISGNTSGAVTEDLAVDSNGFLTASGQLTIIDSDAGQASFRSTITAAPTNLGSLTFDASGAWSYRVNNSLSAVQALEAGQTRTDTFIVTSFDTTDTQEITIRINGAAENRPPTAVNFTTTTTALDENTSTATRIKVADVTVTDDGLGTNNLSLSGTNAAAFELDGTVLYLKADTVLDFETQTSYSVTVNADDPTVGTTTPDASRNFTLTVNDLVENKPPTAVNDRATVTEGQTVTIAVLSNDTDPENNPLSLDSFTAPANGTLTQNPNGTLSYKANLNFAGTDSFTYIAKDSNGAKSSPATVSVSVTPLNLTGTFGNDSLTGTATNNSILGLAGNDSLNGGAGDDTLTGGFGADRFVFASGKPFAPADFGVDLVVDWVRATGDKIVLSKTSFTALASPVGNGLVASDFAAVALPGAGAAGSSSARIVFSQFTGELYYNENGSAPGLGSGSLFARIPSAISQLSRNDFVVIA